MTCSNSCNHQPCPTPWACAEEANKLSLKLHRVTVDDVTHAEYLEAQDDDRPWGLLIAIWLFTLGVVALPFILGAV